MNWLTDFVKPKIQAFMNRSDKLPDDLWIKCPACEQMIFHRDLQDNLRVCPHCQHCMRLPVVERLELLFDRTYQTLPLPGVPEDPLKFKDSKRYVERLKEYRTKTQKEDAITVAVGAIGGHETVVAVMDFAFMGGSMGLFVGHAFVTAVRLAVQKGAPFLVVTASGGARMQEGILSLMQMPATVMALEALNDACLPYLVLLTDPTMGGVSASFAMLGDITLAEPGALIGFAGPRVIEETIKQKLPQGFQRAEFLRDHGMVDIVVPRKELKSRIELLINVLVSNSTKVPSPAMDQASLLEEEPKLQ